MKNKTLQETNSKLEKIEYKISKIESLAFVLHIAADTNIYSSGEFAGALNILNTSISEIHEEILELNNNLFAILRNDNSAETPNSAQN